MCSPILTADPTELSSTTRASHVITGAILCDWNLTADTFSDQEIARQGAIKYDLILAQSLMVWFTAFEACSCITCGTGGFFLARTTRSLNDSATVSRWAPLKFLVLTDNYILFNRLVGLELLLRNKRFDIIRIKFQFTLLVHTSNPVSCTIWNTECDMVFSTVFAEHMAAGEGYHVFHRILLITDIAHDHFIFLCVLDKFWGNQFLALFIGLICL